MPRSGEWYLDNFEILRAGIIAKYHELVMLLFVYNRSREIFGNAHKTLVVYHLPKNSGNFGWDVNGKTVLVCPNGNFPKYTVRLERYSKIPKGNIRTENVPTICHSKPVPGHTPIFMCVTWDASTWLLLRILFSSACNAANSSARTSKCFWSFESAI